MLMVSKGERKTEPNPMSPCNKMDLAASIFISEDTEEDLGGGE